jgi:hypothetical protein
MSILDEIMKLKNPSPILIKLRDALLNAQPLPDSSLINPYNEERARKISQLTSGAEQRWPDFVSGEDLSD